MTRVITHRGLDPSKSSYFAESTREAFQDQLSRGYGLEFDLQLTKDDKIVVMHDATLERITAGKDTRRTQDVSLPELLMMSVFNSHFISFPELLKLIEERQVLHAISAVHLKHDFQNSKALTVLLEDLEEADVAKLVFFDVKIETAHYLKNKHPNMTLAASVAHSYDIVRYSDITGGTLYSLDEVIANRDLFNWVWLDEWDTKDIGGGKKNLYTEELFNRARTAGLKIALVTPELHGTSPGLIGGEKHEDARDHQMLMHRIREILALGPDAVCTDYPDDVRELL